MGYLEKLAAAKAAKKDDEPIKPSGLGRVGRGFGTATATQLGSTLGGLAGAGAGHGAGALAGKVGRKALGTKARLALTLGGLAAGAVGGGAKAYQKTKYKPGESEKKYRGMVGLGIGALPGAAIGVATARKGRKVGEQKKEAAGAAKVYQFASPAYRAAKKRMFAGATTAKGTRAGGSPGFMARLKKGVGEATGFGGSPSKQYRGLKSQAAKARGVVAREEGKGVRNVGALRKAKTQSAGQEKALSAFSGSKTGKRMQARRALTVGVGAFGAGKGLQAVVGRPSGRGKKKEK